MRYALISDIHANLEAFRAVLEALHRLRFDAILFLGDAVGYGPDPGPCVDLLRELADAYPFWGVRGNHDAAVLDDRELEHFNPHARAALLWTREQLSEDQQAFLATLPLMQELETGELMVHASPLDPDGWEYITQIFEAREVLEYVANWIVLVGHTHIQVAYVETGGRIQVHTGDVEGDPSPIPLDQASRYLINPGSVGQPRDGIREAAWGLLDTRERRLWLGRTPYPVEKTAQKILHAGLPEYLAFRLYEGH